VTSPSDFNGVGYADLAVGGFGELVNLIYGSASGLGPPAMRPGVRTVPFKVSG
jgi:hypothetical protein